MIAAALVLWLPFLTGLASGWHCLGMCGGIAGAASALPNASGRNATLWAFSLGRLFSYTLLGLLSGVLGGLILPLHPLLTPLLAGLGGLLWLALGMHMLGRLPALSRLERVGQPLWHHLDPLARRLLPLHTPWDGLAFGLLWGLLPCALAYALVLQALVTASAAGGGLTLMAFGLGTFPATMTPGILLGGPQRDRLSRMYRVAGGLLGLYGVWILVGVVWQQASVAR
ncbi:MAG: sulfite exporter TauE/SafE family protein [Magnetococcus sp. WYHC-3]